MCRAALAIGRGRQEHAELVDLEQDRRLPVYRGQQAGARRDLVAAERVAETGFDEQLGDDLAAVVLAGAAIGDANHVEVGAQVALGPILAAHQRAERAQAGADGEHRLRPSGGRQHVVDQHLQRAVEAGNVHRAGRFLNGADFRNFLRKLRLQGELLQQPARRMAAVHLHVAVEDESTIRRPAVGHRMVVDAPGTDRARLEAAPGFCGRFRNVLHRLRRPIGEQRLAVIPQRALQRHADAHPAVVVEIGVGDEGERRGDRVGGATKIVGDAQPLGRWLAATKPRRPQAFRQEHVRLVDERPRLRLADQRQPADIDVGERLFRPFVRPAGVGMDGKGDELLSLAEDLDRRSLDPLERCCGAVDEQPFRRPADAQRRGLAQHLAREGLDAQRHLGVGDIDIDGGDSPAGNADPGVGPLAPDRDLVIGRGPYAMLGPAGIVAPGAADEPSRLLGARHDRDDGKAVVDQPRPEVGHEARHQNGTSCGSRRRRCCSSRSASARKELQ